MLTDDDISELQAAVETCEEAREELEDALQTAEQDGEATDDQLAAVGQALEAWRDGQRRFMTTVREAEIDDVSTAAMLLKMNHGIDSTEARRGLPGVPVEGADQNFDMELTGTRGTLLTTAAMEYVAD